MIRKTATSQASAEAAEVSDGCCKMLEENQKVNAA
jgi:hypothetical protein